MVDLKTLNKVIDESGVSKSFIATKCNMARPSLYDKLNGKYLFNIEEVNALKQVLHLTPKQVNDIFLS